MVQPSECCETAYTKILGGKAVLRVGALTDELACLQDITEFTLTFIL